MESIENKILVIREQKVMLDRDLAELYGVSTKRLNEQVKRNIKRFPTEFMFRLSKKEKNELVAICDRFASLKHASSLPYAFNELGVAMLASILNSEQAININILIIKAFIKMRKAILDYKTLDKKIAGLEHKYDKKFKLVFQAINHMFTLDSKPKKIGFAREKEQK